MTRPTLVRPLALVAAAATFIAACGGTTATTAPTTAGAASDAPASVVPATQAPSSGLPGFSFDLPNEDTELEGLLPDEIGGVAVTKVSMGGDTFMQGGTGSEDMQNMLTALGKTPADLSVAFGSSPSAVVLAFRVKGVDASKIYEAVVKAQGTTDVANITDVNVGGKPAKKIVDSDTSTTTYLYLTGDALLTVSPIGEMSDATLNEIFSKLP